MEMLAKGFPFHWDRLREPFGWVFCLMIMNHFYDQHEVMIWMFPKIVVPPNHPFLMGFSIINHPFWGTPILGKPHFYDPHEVK